jgi:hypothetical protein
MRDIARLIFYLFAGMVLGLVLSSLANWLSG